MSCSICALGEERRKEAEALKRQGLGDRAIGKKLNLHRSSLQRHFANCCKIRRGELDASTRHLLSIRNKKLEGDLHRALESAYRLQRIAEEKQDAGLLLQAQREIRDVLRLQSKRTAKVPPALIESVTPTYSPPKWNHGPRTIEFPTDREGEDLRLALGMPRLAEEQKREMGVVPRITWQEPTDPLFAVPQKSAEKSAEQVEAEMKLAAEVANAKEPN